MITACQSPGYVEWCRHQHEISQRAREWARCCKGFYTPYLGIPQRVNSYKEQFGTIDKNKVIDLHSNYQRQQETLERIRLIVIQLQQTGSFPERTSDRAQAIIAASKAQYGRGVSQTTLHKPIYLPLWHPDHQKQQQSKQRINALLQSDTAILSTEKYPQLPVPWLEEHSAETLAAQGKEEQIVEIYTPEPYMKVLYVNELKALLPAAPKDQLDQLQKSLPNSNSSNLDSAPDFDSSRIFTVTTDKQNQ